MFEGFIRPRMDHGYCFKYVSPFNGHYNPLSWVKNKYSVEFMEMNGKGEQTQAKVALTLKSQ